MAIRIHIKNNLSSIFIVKDVSCYNILNMLYGSSLYFFFSKFNCYDRNRAGWQQATHIKAYIIIKKKGGV